jgi:hypothetical protein
MKINIILALCAGVMLTLPATAQFGGGMGMGPSPKISGTTEELFGEHKAFTAKMEMTAKGKSAEENITLPGIMAYDEGKSRFEMDITEAKGGPMTAQAAPQMKAMGMDKMVMIARPDLKLNYMIYPSMKAYVEMATEQTAKKEDKAKAKVELTELGKETVDGKACIKNKATITDTDGKKHEALVWKATDLKGFPIKIEQAEQGTQVTLLFKDVKLEKPQAAAFTPPQGFTKYDNMQGLIQNEMMKRMGGQK